jgi:hypothetical protein
LLQFKLTSLHIYIIFSVNHLYLIQIFIPEIPIKEEQKKPGYIPNFQTRLKKGYTLKYMSIVNIIKQLEVITQQLFHSGNSKDRGKASILFQSAVLFFGIINQTVSALSTG